LTCITQLYIIYSLCVCIYLILLSPLFCCTNSLCCSHSNHMIVEYVYGYCVQQATSIYSLCLYTFYIFICIKEHNTVYTEYVLTIILYAVPESMFLHSRCIFSVEETETLPLLYVVYSNNWYCTVILQSSTGSFMQ